MAYSHLLQDYTLLMWNEHLIRHQFSIRQKHTMMQGSTFTALLSEMLDVVRWPSDSWTATGASAGAAGRGVPPLPGSPSRRANHIATAALSSHPYRPLYLSGPYLVILSDVLLFIVVHCLLSIKVSTTIP